MTLPGRLPGVGRRHPLTQVRERVEDIFLAMGYQIIDGPELEDDWHNFEALNMPPDHPARDMQDTLYLAAPVPSAFGGRPATLLRTHTSGMQIRYMEANAPPVRIIAPGRVYRRDNFDATHTPMFTQVEGLVVDEGISLGDLKGTLNAFAQQFFDASVKTRFRPSFFPYTEPSAELDVECRGCAGRAARSASRPAGLKSSVAAWCTRPCSKRSATTRSAIRALPSAWASSGSRSGSTASTTSGCSTRTICGSSSSGAVKVPVFVDAGVRAVQAEPRGVAARLAACGFAVASVEGEVVDFEITANRPDCLSVYGLAREAATAFDVALAPQLEADESTAGRARHAVPVSIGDAGCGRYALAVADVHVGPSPAWLAAGSWPPASGRSTTSSTSRTT